MFKMTCVCSCGWSSSRPESACVRCGQAICSDCHDHAVSVAVWPGDSDLDISKRALSQITGARVDIVTEH